MGNFALFCVVLAKMFQHHDPGMTRSEPVGQDAVAVVDVTGKIQFKIVQNPGDDAL